MGYSNILFRFIHPDSAKAKEDHLLSIKRESDRYLWSYCETNRAKKQEMTMWDAEGVLRNLQRMLHLLSWDEEPYQFIQVVAPGYPMVLLKAADIKDSWPTLREFLEGVFENWPVNRVEDDDDSEAVEDTEPMCSNGCMCEDEAEDDEESEDDTTDSEMPDLVSQEDVRVADILLRLLREPAPVTPPAVRRRLEPEMVSEASAESGWIDEAEKREPIEIRRVVNTPNGPRTHIRFV